MVRRGKPVFALGLFLTLFIGLSSQAPSLSTFLSSPDSGYQLGLGSQVLHGKYPYIDLIFHYGPLVAYTSAFGQWLTGNIVSEAILCALGYAASICLLFFMVRRQGGRYWPYIVAISAYLLLARFYKWYYWLFPVAVLYLTNLQGKYNDDAKQYCRLIFFAGIVAGTGSLFRFDLGPVFVCFFVAHQFLASFFGFRHPLGFWSSVGLFIAGFMISSGIWLGILFRQGGLPAIQNYFYAIFSGGSGVVKHWGISLPPFDWMSPFSSNSATTATLLLLLVVYLCCIGFGIWGLMHDSMPGLKRDDLFLAGVGLMGLGIYPQGYYRADPMHVLQIIPPALVAIPLLLNQQWKINVGTRSRKIGRFFFTVAIAGWASLAFSGLLPHGGKDLSNFSITGMKRLKHLANPLDPDIEPLPKYPAALQAMMNEVISATRPDDPILVVPLAPQIYYFTRRPMSGLLIGYAEGIHDNDFWRARNLAEIRENQPKVVIAQKGFLAMEEDVPFRKRQPELYQYLASNYRKVMYQHDDWLILGESRSLQ